MSEHAPFMVIWFEGSANYGNRKARQFGTEERARTFAVNKIVEGRVTLVWWHAPGPAGNWELVANSGYNTKRHSRPGHDDFVLQPWPSERKQDEQVEP